MSNLRITKEYCGYVATLNKGMLDCTLFDIAVKGTSQVVANCRSRFATHFCDTA